MWRSKAQKLWQPEPGWLNTAAYGLPPDPACEALQEALAGWRDGRMAWESWDTFTSRARAAFARLVGGGCRGPGDRGRSICPLDG